MNKLRILMLAHHNNPDWISGPLVGYKHSRELCLMHDVTLVTHFRNVEHIRAKNLPWRDIHGISLGFWEDVHDWAFKHIFKENWGSQALTLFRIPFYLAFEWLAWRRYKKAVKSGAYDLVFRLTPVTPVFPSLFAKFTKKLKVPFVIGPVNGGLPWPKGYPKLVEEKSWISNLRFLYLYFPFARSTYRDASAIVAGSSHTYSEYTEYRDKLFFVPENGVADIGDWVKPPRDPSRKLQLLSVGRHMPMKAVDLAIKGAAPFMKKGLADFTIVGDGPERPYLEKLAKELGVDVTFTGLIPHEETMEHFRRSDVLVFPSLREFGGGVVFEALSTGCVPIVSNFGGPGDIVLDGQTGFAIDLKDPDYTVAEITKRLEILLGDSALFDRMSKAGQDQARRELSWKGKAEAMTRIFYWVLGRGERPRLVPPSEVSK